MQVPLDPDRVDMRVHKDMSQVGILMRQIPCLRVRCGVCPRWQVTYYEVTQKAGDCIFLPYAMVHWVNKTSPGFQVASIVTACR